MSSRTFDDRDSSVTYSGTWGQSGHPTEEYQGTTTYTDSAGATARLTFTGTGISVFGTIARTDGGAKGPLSSYSIDGNPAADKRFQGSARGEIQYGVNFYEIRNLQNGRHTLTIRWEDSDMQLFLDYFTVVEQSSPPPPPPPPDNSNQTQDLPPTSSNTPQPLLSSAGSPSPSSRLDSELTSVSRPSGDSASLPSPSASGALPADSESHLPFGPSHSLFLPPGQSALLPKQSSFPAIDSSDRSPSGYDPIRLEEIIGGVIGGFAALCITVLLFVLCMRRRRQRQRQRYGSISSPMPEMQTKPHPSPSYRDENSTAAVDLNASLTGYGPHAPSWHDGSLSPPHFSAMGTQEHPGPTPRYPDNSEESETFVLQVTPQAGPLPAKSRISSIDPPPLYQPTA